MKNDLNESRRLLAEADMVLIGAGAGFSAAAGLTYSGTRFEVLFADYIKRYGMTDMYSAGFYPFASSEEKWGYWAKHIYHNRYEPAALPLYQQLYQLVKEKDYFVITTNVDGQFMKAGFAPERFFEVQGNYGEWQCSKPCHDGIYSNEQQVKDMLDSMQDCHIPTALIPKCPRCGEEMMNHLRIDNRFVENDVWDMQQQRYSDFLRKLPDKRVLFLEIGVGFNTPTIIRYPFEQLTTALDGAHLLRLTKEDTQGFEENKAKTITLTRDIKEVFAAWQN